MMIGPERCGHAPVSTLSNSAMMWPRPTKRSLSVAAVRRLSRNIVVLELTETPHLRS
jgi:hypothetical protein